MDNATVRSKLKKQNSRKVSNSPGESSKQGHRRCKDSSPPPAYNSLYPNDASSVPPPYEPSSEYKSNEGANNNYKECKPSSSSERRRKSERKKKEMSCSNSRIYFDDANMFVNEYNKQRYIEGRYDEMQTAYTSSTNPRGNRSKQNPPGTLNVRRERNPKNTTTTEICRNKNLRDVHLDYTIIDRLSREEARRVIVEFAVKKRRFDVRNTLGWRILSVHTRFIWHYHIESLMEHRCKEEIEEPFSAADSVNPHLKQAIKTANSSPLNMWDIHADLPRDVDRVKRQKIPSTYVVEICKSCSGEAHLTCGKCSGKGQNSCWSCYGNGQCWVHDTQYEYNPITGYNEKRGSSRHERCHRCGGEGMQECCQCRGRGKRKCSRCNESGEVAKYTQVKIQWKICIDNHFTNEAMLPDPSFKESFLSKCTGYSVHEESGTKVHVITPRQCIKTQMRQASETFIRAHNSKLTNNVKIRKQEQAAKIIPVYLARMQNNLKIHECWIIGAEKRVYASSFPRNPSVPCCIM